MTIPPPPTKKKKKKSCKGNLSKKNPVNSDTLKKKNIAQEATSIAFKVIKSMGCKGEKVT